MPGVVRTNLDRHIGHPSSTPNPFHQTRYATGSPDTYANNEKAVRIGDKTYCTDPALAGSPNVFVNNIKWHRQGDATAGHSSWIPNKAQTGSTNIFANGGGSGTVSVGNTVTTITTTIGVHGIDLVAVEVDFEDTTQIETYGLDQAGPSDPANYP